VKAFVLFAPHFPKVDSVEYRIVTSQRIQKPCVHCAADQLEAI